MIGWIICMLWFELHILYTIFCINDMYDKGLAMQTTNLEAHECNWLTYKVQAKDANWNTTSIIQIILLQEMYLAVNAYQILLKTPGHHTVSNSKDGSAVWWLVLLWRGSWNAFLDPKQFNAWQKEASKTRTANVSQMI